MNNSFIIIHNIFSLIMSQSVTVISVLIIALLMILGSGKANSILIITIMLIIFLKMSINFNKIIFQLNNLFISPIQYIVNKILLLLMILGSGRLSILTLTTISTYTILLSSNININIYFSIYNVLQLLLIMLIVLSLSSLLTVLERKGLASSQRRLGPSYNGWFGLVQIVMDGIKLVYKDYNKYNNINNKYIYISCILNFIFSYLLFIYIYLDLILYINLSYIIIMIIITLMINHLTIIICGIVISNSKWTILSSLRLILLYFMYDIIFFLILLYLSPSIGILSLYNNNSLNLNTYIENQSSYINLVKYPLLFFVYLFIVLIEAGRIPIDLIESESELISGYSIEYSGFLYALFASAEYSITLFHSILLSIIFFSYYSFNMLFIYLTLIFFAFIIIRSTLPRFKYTHLFSLTYYYLLPFVLTYFLFI